MLQEILLYFCNIQSPKIVISTKQTGEHNSRLTSAQARAVADALIRTANLVDAKNAEIRPQE